MTMVASDRGGRTRTPSRWQLLLLVPFVFAASGGCYRAVYGNLEPSAGEERPVASVSRSQSWRSFYLYGYLPSELKIDAAGECGGDGTHVREIRTRQTFAQGITRLFATSSGVNVYSPWNGEVVCAGDPGR
jgi:hypothetical protein